MKQKWISRHEAHLDSNELLLGGKLSQHPSVHLIWEVGLIFFYHLCCFLPSFSLLLSRNQLHCMWMWMIRFLFACCSWTVTEWRRQKVNQPLQCRWMFSWGTSVSTKNVTRSKLRCMGKAFWGKRFVHPSSWDKQLVMLCIKMRKGRFSKKSKEYVWKQSLRAVTCTLSIMARTRSLRLVTGKG